MSTKDIVIKEIIIEWYGWWSLSWDSNDENNDY